VLANAFPLSERLFQQLPLAKLPIVSLLWVVSNPLYHDVSDAEGFVTFTL
ncbi:uncharacterized protein B0P05DRAFT_607071, partial [Gilbertella persicaria]